jgi:hypothetical protein
MTGVWCPRKGFSPLFHWVQAGSRATHSLIKWVQEIKWQGSEVDHFFFLVLRWRMVRLYLHFLYEVEVEFNLWLTVSRPVYLGVRRPSGTRDQFFFLFEIPFRQLRLCYFVTPSLSRGLVLIYCTIASGPCQSSYSWGRSPAELTAIFYCLIWDSPNLEGQVPIFISPRNRVAQLYPRALGSLFVASYYSQGCSGCILCLCGIVLN